MPNRLTDADHRAVRAALMRALARHPSKDKAIGVVELYTAVFGSTPRDKINGTRPLRKLIEELRREGKAIGSTTGNPLLGVEGGYYLITDADELLDYFNRVKSQGIRKIVQAYKMKDTNISELVGEIQQTLLEA